MTGAQLLNALVSANLLDEANKTRIERDALVSGKTVEEMLFSTNAVDDVKIAELKSQLLKVPFYKLPATRDPKAKDLLPEETVRTYQVLPIGVQNGSLVVGMVNPDDTAAQEALKFIARQQRMNLGVFLVTYADWQSVLRDYSPYKSEIAEAVQSLHLSSKEKDRYETVDIEQSTDKAEDGPVKRIVADTLREAIQRGASDVHFEPQEHKFRIRFRIDGDLHEETALPRELSDALITRIKVLANLKLDEHRVPQDGRFRTKLFDREIDFRVATFPTPLGEKVAIRILDSTTGLRSFEALGLVGRNFEAMQAALDRPYGMILVTGPTGSGKSTTLYATLQALNQEGVNIVSLEDPVEYFISGVNQSQVRPEIGYDFAAGLRQILRQDPDVIMVGEIRDRETADLAVNAALTGHIVLSTLHTNNAAGVIPRLVDMGVEGFLLPSALSLMLAQRLVSHVCQDCKQQEDPSPQVAQVIAEAVAAMPEDLKAMYQPPFKVYRGKGCPKCHDRGIVGRLAIFEVIRMTKEIEAIVQQGSATTSAIEAAAKMQGVLTMRQDGIIKALQGLVLIEEVLKETSEV